MLVTENQLDEWVRGNAHDAQGVVVELVWRLVAASSPRPRERRFPLGDSIGQPGPDGVLDAEFPFEPFVPEGRSLWEVGTGTKASLKATADYKDLSAATPASIRKESVFTFVTPLSGRRAWPNTWNEGAQARWLSRRRKRAEWRDVRVLDGTKLIDWLHAFPSVGLWLAQKMGISVKQIDTPEQRWHVLRSIGSPPFLTPEVFLANRDGACSKLKEVFAGTAVQLQLDTYFPDQVADFVCAYVANMDEDVRIDAVSRCLLISGSDAWNEMATRRDRHILVAEFDLDDAGGLGTKLLEKVRRAGHAVIFAGRPGGIPHPNREPVPTAKIQQIREALERSGYSEERARMLAQKSGGNLGSLLRCLQNLSLMPEWAEGNAAADLAIAELLGAWSEASESDRSVAERLSGKPYGEWIGTMRQVALGPATPLNHRDGLWRMVARYEGWYALGPLLFDDHLDRLRTAAVSVLRQPDPKFELPPDERYAASVHGKVLPHSRVLRTGLAESLALLGSHPNALTSASFGRAELTARLAVREILATTDWVLWSSLNDLLPLLAEAAPGEFLDSIEKALASKSSPFDTVFSQEGSGIFGANYMTGLLWGLETLAWDADHLTKVVVALGELAARDPGGNWGNRPANSLSTILLPWLPQTCASIEKRVAAVETLLSEVPNVAWKLLVDLLPQSSQSSVGSRKPAWRQTIPDDWSKGVTRSEYWEQIARYAGLAIEAARGNASRLADLIERLHNLPDPARKSLLVHLASEQVKSLPETEKLRLWMELSDFVARHRKFSDADWAVSNDEVEKVAAVRDVLTPATPALRHRRLFSERDLDLYEEQGNYEGQAAELEHRRERAVEEILETEGVPGVVRFVGEVESPWRVGIALGVVAGEEIDKKLIPTIFGEVEKPTAQFAGGLVWGRFRSRGWQWVDGIDLSGWPAGQRSQFLAYLPFASETWTRAAMWLGDEEALYWTKTTANPYEAGDAVDYAIDRLIQHGRPRAAIRCLQAMRYRKKPIDSDRAVRALLGALGSSESSQSTDAYEIGELIKSLQESSGTNPDDLFKVEWAYLPILDRHHGVFPKLMERRLAQEPELFCELVRLVFRSRKETGDVEVVNEERKNVAANAYRLLSGWRTPPGARTDGGFDVEAFRGWLNAVKSRCVETGHFEVAMTMVGHVLTHAPADPDGLWIHRAVASELNAKDAGDIRDGFRTELFNARGVHGFSSGREENALAAKYRAQAEGVESAGFHRLAATLRGLAESYDHDAALESSRDPFED